MPGINDEVEVTEAPSLDDVVRAAYEQHSQPDDDKTPETETETTQRARDATGKFVKSAVEAPELAAPELISDAGQKTEQPAQQSNAATPPSFLSAEAKAEWAKTPTAVQAAFLKRDADANEGGRQWSEQKQTIDRTLAPLHELSQQNGIDWKDGLQRLLTVESSLRNPATASQMVAQLAQAYGVDLRALVNGTQQPQRAAPQFDPNVIPSLVNRQVQEALETRDINTTISGFAAAKDQAGQLLHPHFEKVKPMMGFMLTSGQAEDIEDAYQKAIWTDPALRPQVQPQSQGQQVAKARKAAVSVKGAPGMRPQTTNGSAGKSLDDVVREAYFEHAGQAN